MKIAYYGFPASVSTPQTTLPVADYGLVADLFKALPELESELEKAGY